jgi:pimeloyl-ACP methyl ester carboxylesterase
MRIPSKASLLFAVGIALPVAAAAQNVLPDSFVDSDGVRIRYLMRGKGPAVLLLHGFSVDAESSWVAPGILDSLATRYTVIALDQRGHGASEKPRDPSAYGKLLGAPPPDR